MLITPSDIYDSYINIKENIRRTPLEYSPVLSSLSGAQVYLKLDNLQLTGSFKIRGMMNKIQNINATDFNKPFVAASTGNHAAAFGYAAKKYGFKGTLFLPEKTSKAKIKALEEYPIEKRFFGRSSMHTEQRATEYAMEVDGILIHPYNDPDIIKGQGSIAIEIESDLPDVETILVPIGGGGLISGIASYFSNKEKIEIIGCQPHNASEMVDSINSGKIVAPSTLTTIADATAGGIEKGSITFDICKKWVKGYELSSEEEIKIGLALIVKNHHTLIEPACALAIAPLLRSHKFNGKKVVCVLTGKKVNVELLTEILNKYGDHY